MTAHTGEVRDDRGVPYAVCARVRPVGEDIRGLVLTYVPCGCKVINS